MNRRANMEDAITDMLRVLDVVDAMHDDTPEHAAAILDQMGPEAVAEAALRLLDVLVHVTLSTLPNEATVTAEDFTAYIRRMLGADDE